MKVSAYMAQSLDGYIAGINGELDWLENVANPDGSDFGFSEFMSTVDVLLMGRNTFEKVASFGFWPYKNMCMLPVAHYNLFLMNLQIKLA